MTFAHVSAWKIVAIAGNLVAIAFVALDPTVQVALIAAVGLVAANLPNFIIAMLNRRDLKVVRAQGDGINKALQIRADEKDGQLTAATSRADRAEGRREGSDSERERT